MCARRRAPILGLGLFKVFINDLNAGGERTLAKCDDDDTKLDGAVARLEGWEASERNLERWEAWAVTRGVKLSRSQCRGLHPGLSSTRGECRLGEESGPTERVPVTGMGSVGTALLHVLCAVLGLSFSEGC